jgi:hypothetical protein
MIFSLCVTSVCNQTHLSSRLFICNIILSALGRCGLYALIYIRFMLLHITIIIMSPATLQFTIDSLIFNILRITLVDLFQIDNNVYFLC